MTEGHRGPGTDAPETAVEADDGIDRDLLQRYLDRKHNDIERLSAALAAGTSHNSMQTDMITRIR